MPQPTVTTSRETAALPRGVVRVMLRKQLQEMHARLLADLARGERELASTPEERGADTTPSLEDIASDLETREALVAHERSRRRQLVQVEEALARMDEGTYGRCAACGGPIPQARLEALPHAARDAACERRAVRV